LAAALRALDSRPCLTFAGPRPGRADRSDRPRRRLPVRQRRVAVVRTAQPHHAVEGEQLRLRRTQVRRHHRRQGLHPQGVEESEELPKDQHSQRQYCSMCVSAKCIINFVAGVE